MGNRSLGAAALAATLLIAAPLSAAVTTYRWQISNGQSYGGLTTTWSWGCDARPNIASMVTTTMTSAAFGCNSDEITVPQSMTTFLRMIQPTAYAGATTVTGQAAGNRFTIEDRGGGGKTITVELGYVSGGVFTSLGSVSFNIPNGVRALFTPDMSSITGLAPAGSFLAFQMSRQTGGGDVRLSFANRRGAPQDNSVVINVDETLACVPTGSLAVTPGQSLGGNPIDLTSISTASGSSNEVYTVTDAACGSGAPPIDEQEYFDGTDVANDWSFWSDNPSNPGGNGYLKSRLSGDANGATYTPSAGTGPTAFDSGTAFLFLENSGTPPYTPDRTFTRNLSFDADANEPNISFAYAMNGASMGNVRLEVDNGGGWTIEWEQLGDDGNGGAWTSVSLNLFNGTVSVGGAPYASTTTVGGSGTAYTTGLLNIRFVFVSGTSWDADAAIDTIRVFGPSRVPVLFAGNMTQAQSVDTTGWTGGTKCLNLAGDDATCGTPLTPAEDNFTFNAVPAPTTAGVVTAAQTTGATPSIAVTAPYSDDGNSNNTLTYRTRTPSGTGSWSGSTPLGHVPSPYSSTIAGLTCGATYDVEVTFVDADGVSGTNPQTVSNILLNNCTTAGTASGNVDACDQITISAPFTQDININGSTSVDSSTAGASGPWTPQCTGISGASPRTCVDSALLEATDYWYRITYSDADGIGGSAVQTIGPLNTGSCVNPVLTALTATASSVSCSAITVSAGFTGDTNNDSSTLIEYNTVNSWPGTSGCAALTGASPRTCPLTGLANATAYYFRVTHSDPDGVVGTNPQVIGPTSTRDCGVTPWVPSASVDGCNQISVAAGFSGDFDLDGSTDISRGPAAGGPWTAACTGVAGPSPRSCVDAGVVASSTYYYQVTFADPDGINSANPQVIGPYATPICDPPDTTTGTVTAGVNSCTQITVTAPFVGDSNQDGDITVEYNTTNSWPGSVGCASVVGPSPRVCLLTGLNPATIYYTRARFTDPDGVSGTNPQVVGPLPATPACSGNGAAPMVLGLSPEANAVVGGSMKFVAQVYDPDGVLTSNILWGIDGAAPASAVALNGNYNCNLGSQTQCKVVELLLDTTTLPQGKHWITVQATDSAGAVGGHSWAFRVKNKGTRAAGAGTLLRRGKGARLCADCHDLPNHSSQVTSFQYGSWSTTCLTCHTPHQTRNIYLVRESIQTPNSGVATLDYRYSDGVRDYGLAEQDGGLNGNSGAGPCEACHTKTSNSDASPRYRNTGGGAGGQHFTNRCTDCHGHKVGFTATESKGEIDCTGCHYGTWARMTGGVAKASAHTIGGIEGVNDSFADSGVAWSSPLSANAPSTRSCVNMCHPDHIHNDVGQTLHGFNVHQDASDGTTRAVTRDAARFISTGTPADTDFDNAAINGGMCVSCHSNPINAGGMTIGQAGFNASAHNYTTNAYGTWQYQLHDGDTFARNCTKCHADRADPRPGSSVFPMGAVHYSDYPKLLTGATNPAGTPALFQCYDCHGNGTTGIDRSGKDIATDIAKAPIKHDVNADTLHDAALEATVAYATTGNLFSTSRHINCLDCHNPHEAQAGVHTYSANGTSTRNQISAALTGASGVQFNSGGLGLFATPGAGNYTWIPQTSGVTYEYEICFKCHSSFAWGTQTPPNGVSPNGGVANPVLTDVAQEFNPGNASYHPVVATLNAGTGNGTPKGLDATQLTAQWDTNRGNQTMMCSDCHNTDAGGAAAQGPHGSAVAFMLRGPNTLWPPTAQLDGSPSLDQAYATSFCANCHTYTSHDPHNKHRNRGLYCYSCHIVIPHGGGLNRLIGDADGTMPSRYAYGNNKANLAVAGFTKTTLNGYSKSNCGATSASGCSGKHPTTNGADW